MCALTGYGCQTDMANNRQVRLPEESVVSEQFERRTSARRTIWTRIKMRKTTFERFD